MTPLRVLPRGKTSRGGEEVRSQGVVFEASFKLVIVAPRVMRLPYRLPT